MSLATKIRIGTLLLAAWLLIGGFRAALHPKLVIVPPKAVPRAQSSRLPVQYVELRTSTASRVRGILAMTCGAVLVFGVLKSVKWSTILQR